MLEGIMAAHGDLLTRNDSAPRAIIARNGPRAGKVALVIGGGSGHEPTFLGFVGKGLADAAVIGNVFASPPPQPVVDAALATHGGAGVLFMYGMPMRAPTRWGWRSRRARCHKRVVQLRNRAW
ncbi:dihydroxyacetone kinase subunit DhaK [Burkholderia humptydooensis]|nr:dihydroxyacetone kinase subunit DhaK [Burkholderia humptydooensis]